MNGNDVVKFMLRTPLHVFMGDTMLIHLTGRKTGHRLVVPVNFFFDGEAYWVLSQRSRLWWRNLQGGAGVELHLHGRDLNGWGEVIQDEQKFVFRLGEYLQHFPMAAAALNVTLRDGGLDPEDARRLAGERLFVRICPREAELHPRASH